MGFFLSQGGVYMLILWMNTPWKLNMEPTNHPFRKENDLRGLHEDMFHVNLPGCNHFSMVWRWNFHFPHFQALEMAQVTSAEGQILPAISRPKSQALWLTTSQGEPGFCVNESGPCKKKKNTFWYKKNMGFEGVCHHPQEIRLCSRVINLHDPWIMRKYGLISWGGGMESICLQSTVADRIIYRRKDMVKCPGFPRATRNWENKIKMGFWCPGIFSCPNGSFSHFLQE